MGCKNEKPNRENLKTANSNKKYQKPKLRKYKALKKLIAH